ncbi:MAG: Arm DNA-binding domain-containing protein [Methylococcaceae bacterium]
MHYQWRRPVSFCRCGRFVYRFEGKRKKIACGAYPEAGLENARHKAEEARAQIANNIDSSQLRKQVKSVKRTEDRINQGLPILDSFADVTRKWLDSIAHLTSATTHQKKTSRIERLAFPLLGDQPICCAIGFQIIAVIISKSG